MTINYADTHSFSRLFLNYIAGSADLQPFYRYPLRMEGIANSIKDLQNYSHDRQLLCKVLQRQYQHVAQQEAVQQNIAALAKAETFVVATAHQPNLFTGPLYFIYKIVSAIRLAAQLSVAYPHYRFVPMYWMGSEDHDFAEINHLHLYGKTLTWQQTQEGAVGRLPTTTLMPLLDELSDILGNSEAAKTTLQVLQQCYIDNATLGEATRAWVNYLFGQYGLVVINQDDADLKQHVFSHIAHAEIKGIEPPAATQLPNMGQATFRRSYDWVRDTDRRLNEAGYDSQAFPRPINLFYLTDNSRARIETDGEGYFKTYNNAMRWSADQLNEEIAQYTERFSPNVILRPVYQQSVLPAVAWVGGGGELAYWLQLEAVFKAFGVHYPVLVPRNSALWIDESTAQKMARLSLTVRDLFRHTEKLVVEYVNRNSEHELNLFAQKQLLQTAFEQILERALQIDPTLQSSVVGEMTKLNKSIEALEAKMLRAEKRNFDTAAMQIRSIKEKLFPDGKLQERHDNMLPYYIKHGNRFIETLMAAFDPFDQRFTVITL